MIGDATAIGGATTTGGATTISGATTIGSTTTAARDDGGSVVAGSAKSTHVPRSPRATSSARPRAAARATQATRAGGGLDGNGGGAGTGGGATGVGGRRAALLHLVTRPSCAWRQPPFVVSRARAAGGRATMRGVVGVEHAWLELPRASAARRSRACADATRRRRQRQRPSARRRADATARQRLDRSPARRAGGSPNKVNDARARFLARKQGGARPAANQSANGVVRSSFGGRSHEERSRRKPDTQLRVREGKPFEHPKTQLRVHAPSGRRSTHSPCRAATRRRLIAVARRAKTVTHLGS